MRLNFRDKIFLLCVSVVVAVVLTTGLLINELAESQARDSLSLDIEVTQRTFEEFIKLERQQRQLLSNTLAFEPRMKAAVDTRDPATVQGFLDEQQESDPVALTLVTDGEGRVLGQQSADLHRFESLASLPALQQALKGNTVSDITVLNGIIFEITAAPVYSQETLLGVLVTGIVIDSARVERIKRMTNSEITFMAENAITASTWNPESRQELHDLLEMYTNDYFAQEQTLEVVIASERYLSKIIPLKNTGGQPMGVFIIQRNVSEALGFLDQLQLILIVVTFVAILVTLIASFVFARQVTAPVAELVEAANALADGTYDHPITVQSRDEIGYLAKAFDHMRQARQAAFTELERVNIELRQALQALKIAQQELIKSERMSTIGKMASGIIHDFKNPMSTIKGYTQLILSAHADEHKKLRYGEMIVANIDRMVAMTQDLLDFARGDVNLEMHPYRLSELLTQTVDYHSELLASKSIRIYGKIPSDAVVQMDLRKLRRVLDNIIGNAAEAIGENGEIVLEGTSENGHAVIHISDTGGGVPDEIKDRLFEAFVTQGKVYGTGLGLAIAQKIVTDHHGVIWCDSRSGVGATFHIKIPKGV